MTLVLSAVSATLLIGPVGYRRTVFRQRLRPRLVRTGHRYAVAGLVLLLLALVGAVQLAASFVLGAWAALGHKSAVPGDARDLRRPHDRGWRRRAEPVYRPRPRADRLDGGDVRGRVTTRAARGRLPVEGRREGPAWCGSSPR